MRKDKEDKKDYRHEKNWVTTLLLTLFVGYIGLHRFYLGKPFTGLFYLFTFGGFVIGYTIDFFRIAAVDKSLLRKDQKWVGKPIDSVKVLPDGSKKWSSIILL